MKKQGFTLIELLVVVAVVAIMSGLMVPALVKARDRLRRKAAAAELKAPPAEEGITEIYGKPVENKSLF